MESFTFDLMLLDIMLAGGISGIDVLKKIRSNKIQTPVLILSNLHESIDKEDLKKQISVLKEEMDNSEKFIGIIDSNQGVIYRFSMVKKLIQKIKK